MRVVAEKDRLYLAPVQAVVAGVVVAGVLALSMLEMEDLLMLATRSLAQSELGLVVV